MNGLDPAAQAVERAFQSPTYRAMERWIDEHQSEYIQQLIAVTEVPAPPFKEEARARFVADAFRQAGLSDVSIDEEGNVVAIYPAGDSQAGTGVPGAGDVLVISAHLDTVFPEGTDTRVRREGDRLYAPGVGDNSAHVAALLFIARGLLQAGFRPRRDIVFLANVGEEGLGNLRGMRYFYQRGLGAQRRVAATLVLDGGIGFLGTEAVGSRRLSVTYTGPGGHSWSDFGRPSAVHALGRAIAAIAQLKVPKDPKTTFNVGTVSGGTAVNAIAEQANMVVDMRSVDGAALAQLEEAVRRAIETAAKEEQNIDVKIDYVGERPGGRIDPDHPLVRLVEGAAERLGVQLTREANSTDANIPLSLGLPAVVFGIKKSGGTHTLQEYIEVPSVWGGLRLAVLALLSTEMWLAGN